MKKYSTFHFSSYDWNHHAGKISLKYKLDHDIDFEELIFLPEPVTDERLKEKHWQIERVLFALHLIGGMSYYKTCIPQKIDVHSGPLHTKNVQFWNTVYEQGLGEFFYRNSIEFRGLIKFPQVKKGPAPHPEFKPVITSKFIQETYEKKRILVPIGGGKDSMVTIELLKKSPHHITLLRLSESPLIDELAHAAGLPVLTIRRELSPNLFQLNKQGALNGHVPITAYLSILSVLIAIIYDFDAIAMSNERSANEGNVEYKGLTVNHQWSKSIEFERMLRKYITETIGETIEYFSVLRPLSELSITKIFCNYPQYFHRFTSCNTNWKIHEEHEDEQGGLWCLKCPKCLFVFVCLAAFLPSEELTKIFGHNLFNDASLVPLFKQLLGLADIKPFECVGTSNETKAACILALQKGNYTKTLMMKLFKKEILPTIQNPHTLVNDALCPSREQCIPTFLHTILPYLSTEIHQ